MLCVRAGLTPCTHYEIFYFFSYITLVNDRSQSIIIHKRFFNQIELNTFWFLIRHICRKKKRTWAIQYNWNETRRFVPLCTELTHFASDSLLTPKPSKNCDFVLFSQNDFYETTSCDIYLFMKFIKVFAPVWILYVTLVEIKLDRELYIQSTKFLSYKVFGCIKFKKRASKK